MRLDIRTDFGEVSKLLRELPSRVVEVASARALNRAVEGGRTKMTSGIRREFNLDTAFIRDRLRIRRAVAGRAFEIEATLEATGRRGINVIRFMERKVTLAEARKRRQGGTAGRLYVQIKRGGGKKELPAGAFIANKGRTVFQRVGKDRLPIKAITTLDVPGMFNTRRINAIVVQAMRDTFVRRFLYESQRLLEQGVR